MNGRPVVRLAYLAATLVMFAGTYHGQAILDGVRRMQAQRGDPPRICEPLRRPRKPARRRTHVA